MGWACVHGYAASPSISVLRRAADARKLALALEKKALEPVLPRVVDQFQTYLRELRVEDLSGSAAMFRLKEELLRRVNMAVEPVEIKDVLFKEMIVQ